MTLFPLPLTPFEYLFWCDDTLEYPTTFPIQLTFVGELEEEPFRTALGRSVERHPMLAAMIDDTGNWPVWIESHGKAPYLDWATDNRPVDHEDGARMDLRIAPGLRVWVRCEEGTTHLYLQIHHACCDGLAAQVFVEDLLVLYCQAIGATLPDTKPRDLDHCLLHRRNEARGTTYRIQRWRRGVGTGIKTVGQWLKLLSRKPAVLATREAAVDADSTIADLFGFLTHALDTTQVRRLKSVATCNGVTSNDLLLRDLFRTIERWNHDQGDKSRSWLRINMPANERGLADRLMPAANRLSFTFLTRSTDACQQRQPLLHGIHEETEMIKRSLSGKHFLQGIEWASRIRGDLPWFLRGERSFATACLSNVGRVLCRTPLPRQNKRLKCGNAILERISGTPFIRPLTRAAITVIAYANEMTINLRCDHRYFSATQRQSFLRTYVSMIEQTLESGC